MAVTKENITIDDFNKICRTCLSVQDLCSIYGIDNTDVEFILNKYTQVKVSNF